MRGNSELMGELNFGWIMFTMILIFGYITIGSALSAKGSKYGHPASYIVAIACIISYIGHELKDVEIAEHINFDSTVLFNICIPPVTFAAGFNMRRMKMGKNAGAIGIFGVLSTVI